MRRLSLAACCCLVACVTVPAEPPAARADCAAATFPDDPAIQAAFTDRFNGRYWNNEEQVTVWREGRRLYVGAPQGPRVQLRRAEPMQGAGAFSDGCGTTY